MGQRAPQRPQRTLKPFRPAWRAPLSCSAHLGLPPSPHKLGICQANACCEKRQAFANVTNVASSCLGNKYRDSQQAYSTVRPMPAVVCDRTVCGCTLRTLCICVRLCSTCIMGTMIKALASTTARLSKLIQLLDCPSIGVTKLP